MGADWPVCEVSSGVGAITASSFLAELFRPDRFTRGEEVAAYLGLYTYGQAQWGKITGRPSAPYRS